MKSGRASLDAHIARVASLPDALEVVASRASNELRTIIAANIRATRAPDGTPWKETADGHAPLQQAMQSIDVRAEGETIVIVVGGVEARHHLGAVRGGIARPLIPSGSIPGPMLDALERVTLDVLSKHMAGAA